MSLTLNTRSGASVTVGGEYDHGGERGAVTLTVSPSPAKLTPAEARAVARKLMQFADRARGGAS